MCSNFLCGRPRGLDPLPVRMRPPGPDPFLLRVNVIIGWPLTCSNARVKVMI